MTAFLGEEDVARPAGALTTTRAVQFAAICSVAFGLAYICLIVPRGAERVSPIWLPNAFLLATLLLSRRSAWPAAIVAGSLGNVLANIAIGDEFLPAIGLALCNTLEYAGCAFGLVTVLGRRPDMSRPGSLVRYALVAAVASTASAGLASAFLLGGLGSPGALNNLLVWAGADLAGLLVVAPCLVVLGADRTRLRRLARETWPILVLLLVAVAVFAQSRYPLLYLIPAALLLVTWRAQLAGVAVGLLGTYAIAALCTIYGLGPFNLIAGPIEERVLSLQLFLAVCFYVSLPVAALVGRERQLKAEAHDEARKVRMAQTVAHLGYWRFDVRTREVIWSDEMFRIAGRDPASPPTFESVGELIHPDDRERCSALFHAAIARGEPYEQEAYRILTPEGLKHVRGRAVMEYDENGEVAAVFGILLDNTEFVRGQHAREDAEGRYRLIADRARDIIVRADLAGRVIYISPACRALGYEAEELIGTDGADMLHPDDLARFRENTEQLLRDGAVDLARDRQHRFRCKDGSYVWLEGSPTVVRNEAGAPVELLNVFRDVTERNAAEAELADSEARYRLLAENITDVIACYGRDGVLKFVSPAVREVLGYEASDLIGRSIVSLMHPEDVQSSADHFKAYFDKGPGAPPFRFEYRMFRKDGEVVWLEAHPRAIFDPATGEFVEWLDVVRDITERRLVEAALAQSEVRYRTLAENVSDILVRFGPDGIVRYISASCRGIGVDPETAVGQSVVKLIAPEHLAHSEAIIAGLFSGAEVDGSVRRVHRIRTNEGCEVWLEGSPKLVRDESGAVVEVVTVLRDVSYRQQMEAALAESEARFRLFAEKANDLIMQSTPDGRITYMSPSCLPLTGYAPDEVIGRPALDFVHPDDVDALAAAFRAQVMGRGAAPTVRVEYRIRTKDGRNLWLEATPTAVIDPGSGLVATVTDVARDITERRALQEQLQTARAEAEAAAQVKSEFLANMSHELRTPLTSVVGFTKLAIEQPELEPLTRNYVERVSDASRALLSAVNDILDFSKLEAGQISFRPEPTSLVSLSKSALDLFQPQAAAKDINLTLDCTASEDLALLIDPDRMRQVLLNLIGNAVKFTETGGVTLKVRYRKTGRLDVEVRDTGEGIPADKVDRLFKRFSQVDGSLTRTGGTGLGLAICKGIVEAMDGTIGVRTRAGRGSTLHFSVPVARASLDQVGGRAPSEEIGFPGVRVLVADDHPTNRELVNLILAGVGAEVAEAEDGDQAVEIATSWPYDVILMDLRMPRMDGATALARIRATTGPNDATPILAFTADADAETTARLLSSGFQGVVYKPVSPDELIAAIARATDFSSGEEPLADAG